MDQRHSEVKDSRLHADWATSLAYSVAWRTQKEVIKGHFLVNTIETDSSKRLINVHEL